MDFAKPRLLLPAPIHGLAEGITTWRRNLVSPSVIKGHGVNVAELKKLNVNGRAAHHGTRRFEYHITKNIFHFTRMDKELINPMCAMQERMTHRFHKCFAPCTLFLVMPCGIVRNAAVLTSYEGFREVFSMMMSWMTAGKNPPTI